MKNILSATQAAYDEGQAKLKGNGKTVPSLKSIKTPLRDGDLERPNDEAYANTYFLNANSLIISLVSWMRTVSRLLTRMKFTADATAERVH